MPPTEAPGGETVPVSRPPNAAPWRLLPDEPRTVLGWVFGLQGRQTTLLAVSMASIIVAFALAAKALVPETPFWAFTAPLTWTFLSAGHLRLWSRRAYEALPTHPGEVEALPVSVSVFRHGRRLGLDHGWIDFSDGWLVYEGLRTDFALKTSDLVSRAIHERSVDLVLHGGSEVRIASMRQIGDPSRFTAAFRSWSRGSVAEGESVLPPADRHPFLYAALLRVGLTFVPLPFFVGLIAVLLKRPWLMLGVLLASGALAAALTLVFLRLGGDLARLLNGEDRHLAPAGKPTNTGLPLSGGGGEGGGGAAHRGP